VKPGDLVEYSGTYGILLRHIRDRRWKGGRWFTLLDGREIVIMGMDLHVVGRGEQ
jgi:hypothetical protein